MRKEDFILEMGSILHDDWRKSRLNEDGTFEPRIKNTKDENWIKLNSSNQVDIANTKFKNLPSDWQTENIKAAEVAINEVLPLLESETEINEENLINAASNVHIKWLERNQWVYDKEYGNPILTQSYDKLPKDEQEKDLNQILIALQICKKHISELSKPNKIL